MKPHNPDYLLYCGLVLLYCGLMLIVAGALQLGGCI
jgi:hypothetical protein